MVRQAFKTSTGPGRGAWPVLLIVLAAMLVPSGCVLWFMNAAMSNERLAVRQKLTDVYRQKVRTDQAEIAKFWAAATQVDAANGQPQEVFARLVLSGPFSSVIVVGSYPQSFPPVPSSGEQSPQWKAAGELEFNRQDYAAAAEAYGRLAEEARKAGDTVAVARAIQAQARCLLRAGSRQQAVDLLAASFAESDYDDAADSLGRLIAPSARLLALQLMPRDDARFASLAGRLAEDVNRYEGSKMSSSQRLFLMDSLAELASGDINLPTYAAEKIAAEYLAADQPPATELRVTPAAGPGLWQMGCDGGQLILLFTEDKLMADLRAACRLDEPFAGIVTRLEPPGEGDRGEPFLAAAASEHLPGWRLAVYLDEDPFAASAEKAEALYLAAGVSAVAIIAALAAAMAVYLTRQIKLTRLKNNFLATVSHELKTPLASMRVLVDTLREGRCTDPNQAGEYFELIAKENERLSRLIDNFLTFSRMERNKRAFRFEPVDVADAVHLAAAAMGDRFSSGGAELNVNLQADLPKVSADRDALVTVLLNLLDNAWKYSGDNPSVAVRACADAGGVCIDVIDNGPGMSRREIRRIFDKFYQADQTLSRRTGGCGLGLSIVKFILDAHGGTIGVKSQPGKGSTFTVRLPALNAAASQKAPEDEEE